MAELNTVISITSHMVVNQNDISQQQPDCISHKDKEIITKFFLRLSDKDKLTLLDMTYSDTISSKDVALYLMTLEKIKKDVTEKFSPYIRKGSKIVYYAPSKNQFKARIPKALLIEGKTAPECATSELQMWNKLHAYLFEDSESLSLKCAYDKWLDQRKHDPDVASSTVDRNIDTWNKYYAGHPIAKMPLSKLTTGKIYDFYKSYTAGRAITRSELNNIKGILNMIFDYAVANDIISSNIAKAVSTKSLKCKIVSNNNLVYTPAERKTLFAYLISIPQNVYTLGIRLMFCLDVRIGELKALRWSDYDEQKGMIYIHSQIVDRKDKNGKWCQKEFDYTKGGTGGDRWLQVSKTAKAILSQLKLLSGDSEYILLNQAGTTVKTNKFNEHLKDYCTACGIRYLSSHKIRFYAVTEQANENVPLPKIQYRSGHLYPGTTLKYVRNAYCQEENSETWEKIFG